MQSIVNVPKKVSSEKDNFNKLFREYFIKNMSSKLNDFADQELQKF